MTKQDMVDIIIEALTERGLLVASHKFNNSQAVQVKLKGGQYFNIAMAEVDKTTSYIMAKVPRRRT